MKHGQQQGIDAQLRGDEREDGGAFGGLVAFAQPPATAGMIATSSPSLTGVARLSR